MKPTAFVLIALSACLALGAGVMSTVCKRGDSPKVGSALLADRMETGESITYTTDPKMEQEMKKEEREEKEKEKNSWKMLQNMYLYKSTGKPRASSQQSGDQ